MQCIPLLWNVMGCSTCHHDHEYLTGSNFCLTPTELDIQESQPAIWFFLHPKDRVPIDEWKGVVCSIHCTECPKVYIGQTGRSLKHRLKEHWRALRNCDMAASALAEHGLTAGHGLDLSKAEVLDSNPYTILESWHIQQNENKLNREQGNLSEVYTALLNWNMPFLDISYLS